MEEKKRRGRPLKEFDGDVSAAKRRERVRRAQQAFRVRKVADAVSTEGRIQLLENITEKMSLAHDELAQTLLGCDTIRQKPDMVEKLRQSLRNFQDLAHAATKDEETEAAGASEPTNQQSPEATADYSETMHIVPANTTSLMGSTAYLTGTYPQGFASLRDAPQSDLNPMLQESFFGDNWVSFSPWTIAPRVVPPNISSMALARQASPFGAMLVRASLSIAYSALLDQGGWSFKLAERMFRYAFAQFSREELAFIMRWYLGPGKDELPCLAFSTYDFRSWREVAEQPTIQSTARVPGRSRIGIFNPQPHIFDEDYISAFEMEAYLRTLGAFEFNSQTIKFLKSVPTGRSGTQIPPSLSLSYQGMYTFDSFFVGEPGTGTAPDPASVGTQPPAEDLKILTVSIANFVKELAYISACLGQGPGFTKRLIPAAVTASVTNIEDP